MIHLRRNPYRPLTVEQIHTLVRSERLATISELAACTAHKLHNPLTGIQITLDNMRRDCDNQDLETAYVWSTMRYNSLPLI